VPSLIPVAVEDVGALAVFLREMDLTVSGLESPAVRLWIEKDDAGAIVGSTGFELSANREHALIRSVAVQPARRTAGAGTRLALFALAEAAKVGAHTAWLFSRRSGAFWQTLGFEPADRQVLAHVLKDSHQVLSFASSGQLGGEVAWSRPL
jgi:N-acetylglutamate synthase-like GNAT family acetyltransferase